MNSSSGHLHIVTIPPVARPSSIRGQVHLARWAGQTRSSATKYIQILSLEVVVVRTHQATPCLDVVDPYAIAVCIVQRERYFGVRPAFPD
ncbi:hypothetical protein HanRHA438_Chr10g0447301 [Helianthus annuus]|uniref:Uncharacterized protein n=1 Tax=Helianthus annuus TaxID=4232 RepID=A0A9K3HWY4_HELAN|nr:hypothetical protein HanXRQr2_Chr10g0435151 [Helianthus annuus]KAJ0521293.1 hypothetical protein HanIR_Chr10g0469231 [Helianthus annuus]KAJ0879085.1 hypothetical protein HanRHA438_Chr10g0447301 [Helianthus annuus]